MMNLGAYCALVGENSVVCMGKGEINEMNEFIPKIPYVNNFHEKLKNLGQSLGDLGTNYFGNLIDEGGETSIPDSRVRGDICRKYIFYVLCLSINT